MKNSKENGITLIALIITIIVLLILAGISISLVVGDNGVLGQAMNASTATDIAETKEQIELAVIGYLDENGDYTVKDVLEVAKEITGNDVDTKSKIVESAKGNTVDISGILDGAKVCWYYDNDGNITNGSVTLAIGDIVYYNAVTGASTTSYTSPSSANGYSSQTFALTSDNNYQWQVMGVDEDTGELLIVLSYDATTGYNYIKTSASAYYYLKGQTGYANCVTELDNICSLFGQGEGATGARSITVEDVNKLTGYDPTNHNNAGTSYGNGTVYEYGNKVTYTLSADDGYIYYQKTITPTELTQSSYTTFTYYTGSEWITLGSGESVTLTSTSYYYSKTIYSSNSSVVFPSTGYYWLASPYIKANSGYVAYCLHYVTAGLVYEISFYTSIGDEWSSNMRCSPSSFSNI